jgi:hypothetical protein
LVVIGVGGPIVLEGVEAVGLLVGGAADGVAARWAIAQGAQPNRIQSVVRRKFIRVLPNAAPQACANHILINSLKLWEATLYPVNSVEMRGLPLRNRF